MAFMMRYLTILLNLQKFYTMEDGEQRVLVSGNHTKFFVTADLPVEKGSSKTNSEDKDSKGSAQISSKL